MNENASPDRGPMVVVGRPVRVTVSGSFRRHMPAIMEAVADFKELGAVVLSPEDPRIVDAVGEFVFLASDRHRSIRLTEDRHLDAIRHSDFVWLVCPDGYIGPSAALEIGFAIAHGVPILSDHLPGDLTHRHYVDIVGSVREAMQSVLVRGHGADATSLLLDPDTLDVAHRVLDEAANALSSNSPPSFIEARYFSSQEKLRALLP